MSSETEITEAEPGPAQEEAQPTRVSRKMLLANWGFRELHQAPHGERVAVRRSEAVAIRERAITDDAQAGADLVLVHGNNMTKLSVLETYPTVVEILFK